MTDGLVKQAREGRATICIKEAMVRCGVSRRTVYNWLAAGKVEYVRTAGGPVRIFADTLFQPGERARSTP